MNERSSDVLIDVGEIAEVLKRDQAIFLIVNLRHYHNEDGTALQGIVRVLAPHHGVGYGDMAVPTVGEELLCFFPGLGPDGVPGGDLDEGFALGFVTSETRPPVDGLQAALSATRRVQKGKSGVDLDQHVQGDHDRRVDGAQSLRVLASQVEQVDVDRTLTVDGDEAITVKGDATETIETDLVQTIQGTATLSYTGVFAAAFAAAASWLGQVTVTIQSVTQVDIEAPLIRLIADKVEGGMAGAVKKLVHEEFLGLYDAHVHVQSGGSTSTFPPTVSSSVATHATSKLRGDHT